MEYFLVVIYCFCFFVPRLIVDFCQYRHIQKVIHFKPVLLSPSQYIEAGNYALDKLRFSIFESCLDFLFFMFWITYGVEWLNWIVSYFSLPRAINANSALIVVGFLLASQFFSLPFKYYKEMILDKRYGFSKQTHTLFFVDFIKGLLLIFVFGGMVLYALAFLIHQFSFWWFWSALFLFCVIVGINFLYPTLIAPIFNTFTPLEDLVLKEKIEKLLSVVGFQSKGIFVMDASKRDGRLNAYFGGFGKSKRVVLFDTLLDKISSDGLLAILGHELGHFKHKDLIFNVLLNGVFVFLAFFLISQLPQSLFESLELEKNAGNLLLVLFLLFPVISFWFLPIVGYFSRKAEYQADCFGSSLTSKRALAEALVRLVNENKSFPSSHFLYIFFYYSHPPLLDRLKALDYAL